MHDYRGTYDMNVLMYYICNGCLTKTGQSETLEVYERIPT